MDSNFNNDALLNIICGDCTKVMPRLPDACVDFILTDPPYLAHYRDRIGRAVANDDNAWWLGPAFAQMYRLLKPDAFAVSFYGWHKTDLFFDAWRNAGFRIGGHIMFRKSYASRTGFLRYRHEAAYLLVKGNPAFPAAPIDDVQGWTYTGNILHPTQKPVSILRPLIEAFSRSGDTVLDPFAGSGSTLVAAHLTGREYLGIELESRHCRTAHNRLVDLRTGTRSAA